MHQSFVCPTPLGLGIPVLKWRDLTYNVSLQCRGCAGVIISRLNSLEKQFFPIGILGQVWCLIVSIPDLCPLSYFVWCTYLPAFYKLVCKGPYLIFPNVYMHVESHISHAQILFHLEQLSFVKFCCSRQLHHFMPLCKRLPSESMFKFSETTGPTRADFHVAPPRVRGEAGKLIH